MTHHPPQTPHSQHQHIEQLQHHMHQQHHKQQPQQQHSPYIVHPAHLYNNQKSADIVSSVPQDMSYMQKQQQLQHHPANSQAIYVNTITAYHSSSQQQHQQMPQQQLLPPSRPPPTTTAASNVIYVNASSVVPVNGPVPSHVGQHNHFGGVSSPNQPGPRHPGSGGHVPYSPAIHPSHPGYHAHPPQQQFLSDGVNSSPPGRPPTTHQTNQQPPDTQINKTHLFNNPSPPQKLHIGLLFFGLFIFHHFLIKPFSFDLLLVVYGCLCLDCGLRLKKIRTRFLCCNRASFFRLIIILIVHF